MNEIEPGTSTRKRRWYQFPLGWLFVAVTIAAVLASTFAWYFQRPDDEVAVALVVNGRVRIGKKDYTFAQLPQVLSWRHSAIERWGGTPVLVIRAGTSSPHVHLTDLIAIASEAGFEKVRFHAVVPSAAK